MSRITDDPFDELRREIDRSRRGDHAATLVCVESSVVGAGWRARHELERIVGRLEAMVRTIDSVWLHHHAVYLLLPETDREAAEALVSRLWRETPDLLPFERLRMACFPRDGLTPNALRQAVAHSPREREARVERPLGAAPSGQPAPDSEQA
jgi:hypothetical protein